MPQTKIDLLLAICEAPGWQPSQPVSSSVEVALRELAEEGWIVPRLDGWEASPQAIDCYPNFYEHDDGKIAGESTIAPRPEPVDEGETIVHKLPMISLHSKQRIEAAVYVDTATAALKGSLVLVNEGRARDNRVEVEVQIRVTRVNP